MKFQRMLTLTEAFSWENRRKYQLVRIKKQITKMEKMGKGNVTMKLKAQKLKLDKLIARV